MDHTEIIKETVNGISLRIGRPLYYYVGTFGCQMNARDSEKIRGMLSSFGYIPCESEDEADVILYNTCTVREHANLRIYGRLGYLNSLKKQNPDMIIGLCGCMIQEKGQAEIIEKKYPFVDLMFGTYSLDGFPELFSRVLTEKKRVTDIKDKMYTLPEGLPTQRKYSFKSGINISYGCNNFCTYCIVPYVRGREISRPYEDILREASDLARDGVLEVMLLGQNVNSYGNDIENGITFPELLRRVSGIDGIERIRFMTSHPKDLTDELIDAMRDIPEVCGHIHLPVQSGSTRILKRMGRRYTREDYLLLVEKLRNKVDDISITTDIIVGFPGETEEDFNDTLTLVDEVGYDSAFTFKYSKRSGTPAASYEDQIDAAVVSERFDRLLSLVRAKAEKACARFEGRTEKVLCECENRTSGLITGRLESNLLVHFPGDPSLIGKIVPVELTECEGFYYSGKMMKE